MESDESALLLHHMKDIVGNVAWHMGTSVKTAYNRNYYTRAYQKWIWDFVMVILKRNTHPDSWDPPLFQFITDSSVYPRSKLF